MVGLAVRNAGMEESQDLKKMIEIAVWIAGQIRVLLTETGIQREQ